MTYNQHSTRIPIYCMLDLPSKIKGIPGSAKTQLLKSM